MFVYIPLLTNHATFSFLRVNQSAEINKSTTTALDFFCTSFTFPPSFFDYFSFPICLLSFYPSHLIQHKPISRNLPSAKILSLVHIPYAQLDVPPLFPFHFDLYTVTQLTKGINLKSAYHIILNPSHFCRLEFLGLRFGICFDIYHLRSNNLRYST